MPDLTREQRDAYITSVLSSYHRVEEGHPAPCPECEDIVGMVLMIEAEARAEQAAEVERLRRSIALTVGAFEEEVERLRAFLWWEHIAGNPEHHAYGDDGEMQCHGRDFLRDPVDTLYPEPRAAIAVTPEPHQEGGTE